MLRLKHTAPPKLAGFKVILYHHPMQHIVVTCVVDNILKTVWSAKSEPLGVPFEFFACFCGSGYLYFPSWEYVLFLSF